MKLEVGMTVYITPCGVNNTRGINDITNHITETTIEKIGRKYFYVKGSDDKFNIDNLKYETSFNFDRQAYLNKQDILDKVETKTLEIVIKRKISAYGGMGLSLDQLKRIVTILEE